VIGVPDPERGSIVEAHVILGKDQTPSEALIKSLQDHVKATIAPFKYPRSVIFAQELPKTESGKIQRFRLRKTV
jgi:2-aminobenzoate-CoA ligase